MSFLPIVSLGPGQVANEVRQGSLVGRELFGFIGLFWSQFLVPATEFVEGFGSLVEFLLQGLEHLELGSRGNSVATALATTSTTTAAAAAALLSRPAWRRRSRAIS